jgi:hypothetical protein
MESLPRFIGYVLVAGPGKHFYIPVAGAALTCRQVGTRSIKN